MEENLSIINKSRILLPSLPFLDIKNDILGTNYSLSIAFVGSSKSKEINKKYRNKDKPTNILSFPLSKKGGEIILCSAIIKKESADKEKNFGKNLRNYLQFMVINGMLHLKGMEHRSRMEKAEKFYCKKYDKKHINRHRRGLHGHPGGSGRI